MILRPRHGLLQLSFSMTGGRRNDTTTVTAGSMKYDEAVYGFNRDMDCHVITLLAMTGNAGSLTYGSVLIRFPKT